MTSSTRMKGRHLFRDSLLLRPSKAADSVASDRPVRVGQMFNDVSVAHPPRKPGVTVSCCLATPHCNQQNDSIHTHFRGERFCLKPVVYVLDSSVFSLFSTTV